MKVELINDNVPFDGIMKVLYNRGFNSKEEMKHYLNSTDDDVNDYRLFGEDNLREMIRKIMVHVKGEDDAMLIVDSDVDGFTSAAIFYNYFSKLFPAWVEKHLFYRLHEKKLHGLQDHFSFFKEHPEYKLIIVPDAGTNNVEECTSLSSISDIIILDHHNKKFENNGATIINSQFEPYPNKALSGAGVVYQFCRYLDDTFKMDCVNADDYLDLCALGLIADVMSLKSIETKHLINKGLIPDNIHNPLIYGMWQKNKYKITDNPTYMGFAFYIAPFINAVCRSGSIEEKQLVFESMLVAKAFKHILSTKRGHRAGETERVVDQALRVCTNVKNRQQKDVDKTVELLENKIIEDDMLQHQMLLFTLPGNSINSNVGGLVATKFSNIYQRPCAVLQHFENEYRGSMRGYEKTGISNFMVECEKAGGECIGHDNAAGLFIPFDKAEQFLTNIDQQLSKYDLKPRYLVDFIWDEDDVNEDVVKELGKHGELWGKDMDEPLVALRNVTVPASAVTMMASNTLKISLAIDILMFRCPDELYETLTSGDHKCTIVGRPNLNEFNGNQTGQLFMEDIEINKNRVWIF